MAETPRPDETYSYLGPSGTFTEAALKQVEAARGRTWRAVNNASEALADVVAGTSVAAMIAIENSVEGGVTATQDALANIPGLRILSEHLVPVSFDLVVRPGTALADVRTVAAHPVAYGQCRRFLERELPTHGHVPASSNVAAALSLLEDGIADAAIAPPQITESQPLEAVARGIGDNPNAVTRFVLVGRATSLIVELPDDRAGSLLDLLEQFATRGVNLALIQSRPIGDELGRYRFVIDAEGHVHDERVADALLGIRRFSPRVTFLGSYPRADGTPSTYRARYEDDVFLEARDWLRAIVSAEPGAGADA
jgi:prephenate dehydratase